MDIAPYVYGRIGLPPAAQRAYFHLLDQLDRLDNPTPCELNPELWESEDPGDREAAAWGCSGCPVVGACSRYAVTAGERWGVWGAKDRQTRRTAA